MTHLKGHIDQLQKSLEALMEAAERKDPVCDWDYTSEQLQELREMYDFRKLQVEQRVKYLLTFLEEN